MYTLGRNKMTGTEKVWGMRKNKDGLVSGNQEAL